MSRRPPRSLLIIAALAALAGCGGAGTVSAASGQSIAVSGNQLVNASGNAIRLIGVNRSGTEFACTGELAGQPDGPFGYAVFQGPTNSKSITALAKWKVNAVALPLNEACWLGGYGNLASAYSGAPYRAKITSYVNALNRKHMFVVLRLSGAAPGSKPFGTVNDNSSNEIPMADADHSLDFWTSVAGAFAGNHMVLFHAFDEPHDVDWDCVLKGCTARDNPNGQDRYGSYRTVGHQAIVDAIRAAGANQPIILAGPGFAGDAGPDWRSHMPQDPQHSLVADISSFDYGDTLGPGRADITETARSVPVIIGGFGDTDCNSSYSRRVMKIADQIGMSYLAWTWNTVEDYGGCSNALLEGGDPSNRNHGYYTGHPSGFGKGVRDHFVKINALKKYR